MPKRSGLASPDYTPTLTSRKWFSADPTKDGPAFRLLPRRSAEVAVLQQPPVSRATHLPHLCDVSVLKSHTDPLECA